MAASFVVETGDGVAGANSYASVQYFRDHHDSRAVDTSSIADAAVQAMLVAASDYIDAKFGRRFRGYRKTKAQPLQWPRTNAIDRDGYLLEGVPRQVATAASELGLRVHHYGALIPDAPRAAPSQDFTNASAITTGAPQATGVITSSTDRVGDISQQRGYASHTDMVSAGDRDGFGGGVIAAAFMPQYGQAELLLADVVTGGVSRDVVRA